MQSMPQKILIVGPAWIGDMVMAQTLLKLIKQRQPTVLLHVIAPAWSQALLAAMPEVDQSFVAPFAHGEFNLLARYRLAVKLREQHYQQAIVLPNSFKSALIPFFAKIPQRTGWKGEMRFGLLNDIRALDKTKYPRMIDRFMALALPPDATLPPDLLPQLAVSAEQINAVCDKYHINHNQPFLALCPGAEYGPAKRWPAQHFAAVAKAKIKEGWQVGLLGSTKDAAIAAAIQNETGNICLDLTGKTNLAEAIELLASATAVISNDSGLMHIAAALDRPLVVIYGSSSPNYTPPLSARAKIVSLNLACSPCFKRECPLGHLNCLRELSPQLVLDALLAIMSHANMLRENARK